MIRQGREAPDVGVLDALREVTRFGDPEAAGQLRRGQAPRQLDQRQRVAPRLGQDPVADPLVQGERHRRVQQRTGVAVHEAADLEIRHVLEDAGQILSRANQALATLERYKLRLDEVASTLSALEIEDLVTARDVAVVAQRLEMVTRIAREIEDLPAPEGEARTIITPRRASSAIAYSRFWTCSRNWSITALRSRPIAVSSTALDLEHRVFASRLNSCDRKSSLRPTGPPSARSERADAT